MFYNYLKIAWRNIKRQKIYSTINIVGLTVGLTISLVIGFYVIDDITFDRFHKDADNIYRVITTEDLGGQGASKWAIISGPIIPAAKSEIPEVVGATRIISFGRGPIARGDSERSGEEAEDAVRALTFVTDPGFFDVFDFKILAGDASALATSDGVLLTPEIASAVFGDEDPMGKPLQLRGMQNAYVAGIVEAPPSNSHIQYEIIIPLRVERNPVWWDSWENQVLSGYIRIRKNADPERVKEKMIQIARANGFPEILTPGLQPLLDVHLDSTDYGYDFRNVGKKDASVVYVMSAIGLMILLIASINFINLSSARAVQRAREVGMRKIVGSKRWQLIFQFLGESVFITVLAMAIALVVLQFTLPHLENFLEKRLDIDFLNDPSLILILLGTAILVGLISGIYPALILSAYKPIKVIRGEFQSSKAGVLLRRILVVCQFVITVGLILSVFTVLIQIRYLKSMDMGYNREQVLVIPNFFRSREDLLKNQMKNIPAVLSVGRSSRLMGEGLSVQAIPEGADRTRTTNWSCYYVDEGFFEALDITLAYGRNFSNEIPTDAEAGVIINEAGLRLTGWDTSLNKRIDLVMEQGGAIPKRVVGVVKDFHFTSARRPIGPMVFLYNPRRGPLLLSRLTAGSIVETRNKIKAYHDELFPDREFNSFFLDDIFDQQFNDDREFASHIGFFSGVAIFIACLGLIGLVSFAVEQRRREIAVRKVLGCSEKRVVTLLAMDFLKWIVVANLIAWPLGYFSMQRWLDEFVYRVPFTIWPFVLSGTGALIVAMLTISIQSLMAARLNPADVLRQDV